VDRGIKEMKPYLADPGSLIPGSAPMVEEIAEFWRKYYGVKE
jgi:hypothetical protein